MVIATAYIGVFFSLIFLRFVKSGKGKPASGRDSWYIEAAYSLWSDDGSPPSGIFTLNIRVKRTVTFAGGFSSPARLGPIKLEELVPVVKARDMGPRDAGEPLAVLPGSSSAEMMCILVEEPR